MRNITALAIDLAKNWFQLHGTDSCGKTILKKKVSRAKLLETIANLPPCNIYMEGCATANYWGRQFKMYGHKVQLINPIYVTPYVKRNKNDANDAAAIAAAARDPDMRFCEVKTEAQQDIQSIHRIRSLLIREQTALANQIRGLLAEYGVVIPKGIAHVPKALPTILSDNPHNLSGSLLDSLAVLYKFFLFLKENIDIFNRKIDLLFKSSESSQRLADIPGVGKLGATMLASILGNGAGFKNGRHFAAFLGLTPRQHSSGGKECLLGISKGGDTYLRTLLIHGARAVVINASKKTDKLRSWINNLRARKGCDVTTVALANKIARTAWAIVHEGSSYTPNHKPASLRMA